MIETFIHELSDRYVWSKDYERLVELMKKESIICQALYRDIDTMDICHSLYQEYNGNETFSISCRGTGYIWARSKEDFIKACKTYKVSFLDTVLEAGR